jgi:hypothetical protein
MSDAATACRRLLALLAQDAPAEDYQELVATLPEVEGLVDDALKVRQLLQSGRGGRPNSRRCTRQPATCPHYAIWSPYSRP